MAYYITDDNAVREFTIITSQTIRLDNGTVLHEDDLNYAKMFAVKESAEAYLLGQKWDSQSQQYT